MMTLVADDDLIHRFALEEQLKEWGYQVIGCGDGLEALERLEAADGPKLALLDWSMPEMDGTEVCRRIRSRNDSTSFDYCYIIMLTTHSDHGSMLDALNAGADDFMSKPYSPAELRMRLRAASRLQKFHEYLREQAIIDPLTGCLNRRGLDRVMTAETARSQRTTTPCSVIAVDLDFFKDVNDRFGHDVGDQVLIHAARCIKNSVRDFDSVARTGGEEFIVICPGVNESGAVEIAERIRVAMEDHPFVLGTDESLSVTASFGVAATQTPDWTIDKNLLDSADRQLYRAKSRGRNQVCSHSKDKENA